MFTFVARPRFGATVTVHPPGGGEPQTFEGQFEALPEPETEALQSPDTPREQIAAKNREWLDRIFIGWGEDLVVDGKPLPVTPEAKAMLLGAQWVRSAVTIAYLREVAGASRKN